MSARPASKSKWGARKERTPAELNQLCHEAFSGVQVPQEWKFKGYDTAREQTEGGEVIHSVGAIFLDTRTSGINLKHYRVFFHSYSERLGVIEKYFKTFGEQAYTCLVSNKTVEALNEWISEKYSKPKEQPPLTPPNGEEQEPEAEPDDGLQGIRDMIAGL